MALVPKSLTTVTLFSKILATIILVMIIPMASFYAGMQYEKAVSISQLDLPTAVTHADVLTALSKKLVRDYITAYTSTTTPLSKRLKDYKVFAPDNFSEKDNKFSFDITISVLPFSKQANAFWLTGNGTLLDNGWIVGKKMTVIADRKNGVYQLESILPTK